jgi:ComEC/Rec2-related protein
MTNVDGSEPDQARGKLLLKRPVVGMSLAFVAGTWAGLNWPANNSALLMVAMCSLAVSALLLCLHRKSHPSGSPGASQPVARFLTAITIAFIYASLFATAWLNAGLQHEPTQGIPPFNPDSGTEMAFIGTVTDEPVDISSKRGRPGWRFPLEVEGCRLKSETAWHRAHENVLMRWFHFESALSPRYGDKWIFTGVPSRLTLRSSASPGSSVCVVSVRNGKFLSAGQGSVIIKKCLEYRASAERILSSGIEAYPEAVAILDSLLLGYRSAMPTSLYRAFAATGTLHIFAISGSHVVVLAAVIIFVLGACGISRMYWAFFLGPLLIFYTVMTGLQPSAVRACVMAVIYWAAPLLKRKPDISATLAASAMLILAVNPEDLMNIGFILSFVAVIGLAALYPMIIQPLLGLFAPDPFRLQPESRWTLALRAIWKELSALFAVSTAAWIVSAPLTAYYFSIFSPIGLLGNLLAVPLASFVIVTGALSLVLGSCVGFIGEIFNYANLVLVSALSFSIKKLAAVPYGNFQVEPPSGWLMTAFYLLLAILVVRRRKQTPTIDSGI